MKIDFNINNYVEFELTEYGANILNDREAAYAEAHPHLEVFQNTSLKVEGQLMKMQLWDVISTFGEYTTLGLETFCKNATITLKIDDVN